MLYRCIPSLFFNEPEATAGEPGTQAEEPKFEEVVIHRKKKQKGKREDDLTGMPVTVIRHEMSEDELKAAFPDGNISGFRMKYIKDWNSIRLLLK